MITNKTELIARLSDVVVSQLPLSQEAFNDILHYVMDQEMKHSEAIKKWIDKCDKLMEKLSETQ
jgi:hypothetical protein